MSESFKYFGEAGPEPSEPGRLLNVEVDIPPLTLGPGLTSRPVVGRNLLASFVRYEPGAVAPRHAHVEEQLFMVLEGELEMELGDSKRLMRPGDIALIPSWVPHGVRALAGPAYQVDVFSPPRQALLALLAALETNP